MKTLCYGTVVPAFMLYLISSGAATSTADRPPQRETPAAASIQLEPVVSGLTNPLFVTNAHDGSNRLFIVEQPGHIKVLQPGSTTPTVFLDISSRVLFDGGERGLLGMAFHPFYRNTGRFFVYYTRQTDGTIVIAEYHVSANDPNIAGTTETVLLTIPHPTNANHNGGMLAFGPDGFLYAGPGDGGSANDPPANAQNKTVLLGKILRIDIDHPNGAVPYSSPPTNPFFGSGTGRDEIYALGMRNPFRFSFDSQTGTLYCADVGQDSWEEIDTITLGGNYGWRVFEGMHCTGNDPGLCTSSSLCSINGYTCPIVEYGHLNGRCAIIGGYAYRGVRSSLPAGVFVYGDLCTGEIITLSGTTQTSLLTTGNSISSFGVDEFGEVYVVEIGAGSILRIAATSAACSITGSPSSRSFSSAGGSESFSVAAPTSCGWSATSSDGFVTVSSGMTGTGYGVVDFSVASNSGAAARKATITVGSQALTLAQGAKFNDVLSSDPFFDDIGKLSARGVTIGCGGGDYCPTANVTRGQMAAFIVRALGDFNPPTPTQQRFADVPPSNPFYAFIDQLAAKGITLGCGGGNYCPDDFVTREQMAAFIMRALGVTSPTTPTSQRFADVPPTNVFYGFIDQLGLRGITLGCGGGNYCPHAPVTRAEMAALLVRAFGL